MNRCNRTKRVLPRHFLCLKGVISMDFSKGAMFARRLGRFWKGQWLEVSEPRRAAETAEVL